ncbi:MAG: hypothetical protein IKE94_03265, partial [Aeriscardovia sp.]|nr:hypothetical protein [Aeriscardovia sp.]
MDKNRERHFNCCGTPKVGFLYFPSFSEFFDSTLSKMRALPQFSCFCCFETTPISYFSAGSHLQRMGDAIAPAYLIVAAQALISAIFSAFLLSSPTTLQT